MRKLTLFTNGVFHIYNRGVEKRTIFPEQSYYQRFLKTLKHTLIFDYPFSTLENSLKKSRSPEGKKAILHRLESFRIEPLAEVISFCLMPNHYHLTLKQLVKNGITKLMHRIGTSYTKYFNLRQERTGRLFESTFKAVSVESDFQLHHLTRYQHLNPKKMGRNTYKELLNYPWSSLKTYTTGKPYSFVNPKMVLGKDANPGKYEDFMRAEIDIFETLRLNDIAIDDDFGWFEKYRALEKKQKESLQKRYSRTLKTL